MTPDARRDDDPVVRPGTPSFRCLADQCGAMCCRNPYRVDLGEAEVERLARAVDVADLLDERTAMVLLRQPDGDACALLGADLRCNAYEARPNGCRDYPFRRQTAPSGEPQIIRDLACPGFVGEPLSEADYDELLKQLQ